MIGLSVRRLPISSPPALIGQRESEGHAGVHTAPKSGGTEMQLRNKTALGWHIAVNGM
jgi:hypothetical protein